MKQVHKFEITCGKFCMRVFCKSTCLHVAYTKLSEGNSVLTIDTVYVTSSHAYRHYNKQEQYHST